MVKMLAAYTAEVDDAEIAVAEIREQLDLENSLLKNSVGIVTCYSEFVANGIVKALAEALPFKLIGATTLGSAAGGDSGMLLLTMSVLTSDDAEFSVALSEEVSVGNLKPVSACYDKARSALKSEPKLTIAFLPLYNDIGGEAFLKEYNTHAGNVPFFGTLACDHSNDYSLSSVFVGGEYYNDRVALLVLGGAVNPKFFATALSSKKIQKQTAVITSSRGSLLTGVNNKPPLEYMRSLGLTQGDGIEGLNSIPFLVDYNDGTPPVAFALYLVTPEGNIVCGGDMPVGATLAVGSMEYYDVLETTEKTVREAVAAADSGVLIFSCLGRNMVMGTEVTDELDLVRDTVGDKAAYHMSYSGGEYCPLYDESGKPKNKFHNFSIVACAF